MFFASWNSFKVFGNLRKTLLVSTAGLTAMLVVGSHSNAMSLKEAVKTAVDTNPEILSSIQNREAIEFELRQARGLYLPTVDLEAGVGVRRLDSPTRRALGTADDRLDTRDVSVLLSQTIFDGFGRRAEVQRQAARVDGASFRVGERTEAIALNVAQEYFEILLQREIIKLTRQSRNTLSALVSDIRANVESGTLTDADRIQGAERLRAITIELRDAEQDLIDANIRFEKAVGTQLVNPRLPKSIAASVPKSIDASVSLAVQKNPRISAANADIRAADAEIKAAKSTFLPNVALEARASTGNDIDGIEDETNDVEARVVLRWNIFNGTRNQSLKQETIRRSGELRAERTRSLREVQESIKIAWNQRFKGGQLAREFRKQADLNDSLFSAYRSQLLVGERSLLDLLSVQDTRFSSRVAQKTAEFSVQFANYQILAAIGVLNDTLNVEVPEQTEAYASDEFNVPEKREFSEFKLLPSRQVNENPLNLLVPAKVKE